MHIKTGSWEATNTVCESDPLCDPAVLVSAASTEPQIRNRRLSPGSGNCGGGGGGGCMPESNSQQQQQVRQISPETQTNGPTATQSQAPAARKDKERKAHKGRSSRRESQRAAKERKASQKERWVEDSLSLLKPPPAFPVQDSPAKLQPAVSYASKVKAGAATGGLEEDRPAIGVLLQNQWGLSFISEARPVAESPDPSAPVPNADEASNAQTEEGPEDVPSPVATTTPLAPNIRPPEEDEENNGKLLLSCRHLVEALHYHSREWNATCSREKKDPKMVVWYNALQDNPA
uniref:Si:ch211-214j24.10 n=1 Tax=Neogobius melanostomus TaxID=47308 RepID=A0A8C6V0W4_9GOBI